MQTLAGFGRLTSPDPNCVRIWVVVNRKRCVRVTVSYDVRYRRAARAVSCSGPTAVVGMRYLDYDTILVTCHGRKS